MSTLPKFLTLITIGVLAVASTFGITMSMGLGGDNKMSNCPLMDGAFSLCRMSVTDHVSRWQALFAAVTPSHAVIFLVLLVLGSAVIAVLRRAAPVVLLEQFIVPQKGGPDSKLFNHFVLIFSDGILHPKIY